MENFPRLCVGPLFDIRGSVLLATLSAYDQWIA